jgi:hypothetical protein
MKMGKVRFLIEYAVDLDNPDQIEVAKDFVTEDVFNATKFYDTDGSIDVIEDPSLTYADIHPGIVELTLDEDDEADDNV